MRNPVDLHAVPKGRQSCARPWEERLAARWWYREADALTPRQACCRDVRSVGLECTDGPGILREASGRPNRRPRCWLRSGSAPVCQRIDTAETVRPPLRRRPRCRLGVWAGVWKCPRVVGRRRVLAIDGRTVRGARDHADETSAAPHLVAAFDDDVSVVLGHACVAAESNEITAARTLLTLGPRRGRGHDTRHAHSDRHRGADHRSGRGLRVPRQEGNADPASPPQCRAVVAGSGRPLDCDRT